MKIGENLNISSFLKNILINVSWALLSKVINMFGTLVMGIFIARYLGVEQYGELRYAMSIVTVFYIIAQFGSNDIIVKELSKSKEQLSLIGTSFILRSGTCFLTLIALCIFLFFYENDIEIVKYTIIYAIVLISIPLDVSKLYFIAKLRNDLIAKANIIKVVVLSAIKTMMIIYDVELVWFVVVSGFDILLPSILTLYFYLKKNNLFLSTFNKQLSKKITYASLPLLLAGMSAMLSNQVDQIMLGRIIGQEAVGYYAAAVSLLSIILFLPQIACSSLMPVLVGLKEKSIEAYSQKMQLFSDIVFWGTTLLALLVFWFSDIVIELLYGVEYLPSVGVLKVLVWKATISSFGVITAMWAVIEGRQRGVMYRDIIGTIINICVNFLLIPKYGILGAAWATIISYTVGVYFSHYFILSMRPVVNIQNSSILLGVKNIIMTLINNILK